MQAPPADVLDSTTFDPREDPLLAEVFGEQYRIEWRLSIGGMSRVYRATHLPTGTPVAVKVLFASRYAAPSDVILSFAREAEVMRRLRHPHVVEVYDAGTTPRDERYLVMELLNGRDLAERLEEGPLRALEAVELADQVLTALQYAHGHGVVHRDLKPGNIWLCGPRELPRIYAKLVDFGVAKVQEAEDFSQPIIGTPAYMAPEQIRWNEEKVDGRADLYALGMTLYEALTGQYPFDAKSLSNLFAQIHGAMPPAPLELRPDLPASLSAWVMRALAKRPEERFSSAEEMRRGLREVRAELSLGQATKVRKIARFFEAEALREQRRVSLVAARGEPGALAALEAELLQAGAVLEPSPAGTLLGALGATRSYGEEARRAVAVAQRARRPELALAVFSRRLPPRPWGLAADELLAGVSDGEARLDRDTYLQVRGLFDLRPADGGGYVVIRERPFGPGRRGVLGGESPTVGRARELATLQEEAARALDAGEFAARLLLGEAGVGKSRLKVELRRALSESRRPFEYVEGQGEPLDAARPYAALARALRLFGLEEASHERVIAITLGQLRELSGMGGVLVVFEDLQWADAATREVLAALVKAAPPRVFLLGLARAEPEDEWAGIFPRVLTLEPLSSAELRELVRAVAGEDEPLASFLRSESRGNPFFAEEALQSMRDAGLLVHDGECWRRQGAPRAGLSVGIECLLQARLDALPQAEKELVKRAALFDEKIFAEALFSLGAAPEALGPVTRRGLLWERVPSETPGVRELFFRAPALREVAARLLPDGERAALHAALGVWLAARPKPDAAAAARHMAKSGEREAALGWFARAAQEAAQEGRAKQAAALLGEALELAPADPEPRARLLLAREEALVQDGQHEAAREAREALAALALDEPDPRAEVLLREVRARVREESPAEALALLPAAREAAGAARAPEREAELLLLASAAHAALQRPVEALALAEEARSLSFALERPGLVVRSLSAIAAAQAGMGDYYAARVQHEQALVAARRFQDLAAEAQALVGLAALSYAVGRLASAASLVDDALRCVARGAPAWVGVEARILGARSALWLGKREAAHGLLIEARAGADAAKDEPRMARARVALAELCLLEGGAEEALDTAAEALELNTRPWDWVAARAALAGAHLRRDGTAAALAHARAGLEEAREARQEAPISPEDDPEQLFAALGAVLAAAGETDEAARAHQEARAMLEERAARISDEATRYSFLMRPGPRRDLAKQH